MGLLDRYRRRPAAQQPKPSRNEEPRGGSGRGHVEGYLQLEELNTDLQHPQSHRVFDRMYRTDADVHQVVRLAIDPILGGTWDVQPFGGEQATAADVNIADTVRWALFEALEGGLLGHLSEFLPVLLRSGFVPGEVVWGLAQRDGQGDRLLVPVRIEMRLPRSVYRWITSGGELRAIEQYVPAGSGDASSDTEDGAFRTSGQGPGTVRLEARNLVYYRVGAEGDNWEGVSMLRPAYKHWFIKDKVERLDAIAQEREAVGIPVVYPPQGASPDQLDRMEDTLQAIRANDQAYIIMPGPKAGEGAPEGVGWLFELQGYDRSGGGGRDPQKTLEYHSNKIAAAFIAEFMRLGHGTTGARATAQVQADPFLMSIEALVGIVEEALNCALVAPFVAYNFRDVHHAPRLRMSLVDSTSLSQLSDFVLKLTQVGALLPDQELEDFLRARADLPPANPEAVKRRKAEDDTIRRMIVGGDPNAPTADPFGSNDPTHRGQHHGDRKGGAGRQPGAPGGRGAAGQNRDPNQHGPSTELDGIILSMGMSPDQLSYRFAREPRDYELAVDLVALDDEMNFASDYMLEALEPHIYSAAPDPGDRPSDAMVLAARDQLYRHYRSGRTHVADELCLPGDGVALDRGVIDRGVDGVDQRAATVAGRVHAAMVMAREDSDLHQGDDDAAAAQAAAERAGLAAARRQGRVHGVGALLQGRHDMALDAAPQILGARYVSILDNNRCEQCALADDGQVRALDDPVREDRRPPNRHCLSLASGENRCRCFEVYEPMPPGGGGATLDAADVPNKPGVSNWVERRGGLPAFIARIAGDLITERGMDVSRAISVAVSRVRLWASGGKNVSPETQAEAAKAVAEWDAKRASA